VLEGVARESRVICLDVHFEILVKSVLTEETNGCGSIEVITGASLAPSA
jgi:hypothetical protein